MKTTILLAEYACHPDRSRGRLHAEPESATRSCFQRDRDRIIHSQAFRRLQYKTQVFVNHEGDFFRTRLTHSLEVAQIARSVCRSLGLNEDLSEALALGHDLGHPPFGHAGEDALNDMLKDRGGFDHNAQSLKVVTQLEQVYPDFPGLNLTWETLEGVVKHNGPLEAPVPRYISDYNGLHDLEIQTYPGAEAQVAALADDIAYDNHDIDDGLRAGLFTVADLEDVPIVGPVFHEVRRRFPDAPPEIKVREAVRRMIGDMVGDLLAEAQRRLADLNPRSVEEIRAQSHPVIAFSARMAEDERALKEFLRESMYSHYKLNRMTSKARRVVRDLFTLLMAEPNCLPTAWRRQAGAAQSAETVLAVTDYIAGITDRFALDEHKKLFDVQARAS